MNTFVKEDKDQILKGYEAFTYECFIHVLNSYNPRNSCHASFILSFNVFFTIQSAY